MEEQIVYYNYYQSKLVYDSSLENYQLYIKQNIKYNDSLQELQTKQIAYDYSDYRYALSL